MFEIDFERLAAVSICFVAAWPLARRLFQPKLWRNGSRKAVVASLLLSAYAISIVAAAFYAPMALWALTLAALIGIGLYVWITRDNFGRRQGLPPGSLAPAAHSDQASLLRRFRKHGPVFKVLARYQPAACVVGHSAASELLTSNADKLAAVPAAYNKHIPKGFLRYMRGADHAAYRRKFQSALPPSLVQSNEADLRALLRERFADWDGPVDPAVTSAMFAMMVRLFLGIMPDDPRAAKIRAAYGNIAVTDKAHAGGDRAADALTEVEEVLAELTNRPAVAGDTETVLGALLAGDASALDDPTVRRNLIYMLETAHRDVSGTIVWVLKILSNNRAWADRLRAELAAPGPTPVDSKGRGLADRIIMESLRMERSEYLFRKATSDVPAGPFNIPKGWRVRICIREWHRANPAFDQPDTFNPDRFRDRTFERSDYAPFGLDDHRCLGQKIAADVGRMFLEELFGAYDFEVVRDGPVEFGGSHWQPNRVFQLRLIPAPPDEASIAAQ